MYHGQLGSTPGVLSMAKCTVVMRSGKELIFECTSVETKTSNIDGTVSSLQMKGIKGQTWHHIVLNQIDAIPWEEKTDDQPREA